MIVGIKDWKDVSVQMMVTVHIYNSSFDIACLKFKLQCVHFLGTMQNATSVW